MAITYDGAQAGYDRRSHLAGGSKGVQKMGSASGLAEVLNVILEKGIVIDAWVRVSVIGIEIVTIEARVVIASVDTYLRYAEAIGLTTLAAAPRRAETIATGGLPGLPTGFGGPTAEEIVAYLDAHPDGVRLSELQAYFGADREELQGILNQLVQEGATVLDAERRLYRATGILAPALP